MSLMSALGRPDCTWRNKKLAAGTHSSQLRFSVTHCATGTATSGHGDNSSLTSSDHSWCSRGVSTPLSTRVTRWGGGLPQYTVGHRERVAAMRALLGLFELEKALYELRYELNNRPDWVRWPLAGIARLTQ